MQILLNFSCTGESLTAPSVDSLASVRCLLTLIDLAVVLNISVERCPAAADYKHVLTAAEPGNNVASLTWMALDQYQFRYNHQIQPRASGPWPAMYFYCPNLKTHIATLDFDGLETGHRCVVEDTAMSKLYTRMQVVNEDGSLGEETDLKFISGNVQLID